MIKKQKKATRILNCLVDWDIKHVSKDASGKMIIKGFANTSDRDRVGDVVLPSAFEKSLAEYLENPVILFQHNWDKVIGKCIKAEIVSEGDQQGLYIEAEISGAKDVEEVKTKIAEGILKTFSIGYNEIDAEYDEGSGVNVVKELELLEISVVTIPCNPKAKFTAEVDQEKSEEKSVLDLDGLFDYLADSLKELGSLEDVDGQFLSELSDLYMKGGPGSGRKPGGASGKPKPSSEEQSEEGEYKPEKASSNKTYNKAKDIHRDSGVNAYTSDTFEAFVNVKTDEIVMKYDKKQNEKVLEKVAKFQDGVEAAGFKVEAFGSTNNNLPKQYDMYDDTNKISTDTINKKGWVKL